MKDKSDFAALRESGTRVGTSHRIGNAGVRARIRVARALIRLGLIPNHVTAIGFLLTLACAACLLFSAGAHAPWETGAPADTPASWLPILGFVFLLLASVCDMLDGEMARGGGMGTPFGGVLDSTFDRLSDGAFYLACGVYFAAKGNVTYNALAIVAMCNAYLISYVKARAEELIDDCEVGWWLRPERNFGMLVATLFCHSPAFLWQQATLPAFTWLRRILYTRAVLAAKATGGPLPDRGPMGGLGKYLALWRYPRGSFGYDLIAAFNIGTIIVLPWIHPFFYGGSDPLGDLLVHLIR